MILLSIILICISAIFIWGWIKLMNALFNPVIRRLQEKSKNIKDPYRNNPYVLQHKLRHINDAMYDQYIEWMDSNNFGLPIEKIKTKEELKFEKELMEENKKTRKRR